jgi:hypothetical protein
VVSSKSSTASVSETWSVSVMPPAADATVPVGAKSCSQLSLSGPVCTRKTAVPSGAATEVSSASSGWRRRGSTGASNRSARRVDLSGSSLSTASAQMEAVPGVTVLCGAKFNRIRALPCSQSCTGLERCCPVWTNPSPVNARAVTGPETASTASSVNTCPASDGADGKPFSRSRSRTAGAADAPAASCKASSDRMPSIAAYRGSACR